MITKRKTGSRFLIESLSRLGHSIGYDEVNNVETYFTEVQAYQRSHRSFVPNNVQPSTFITFVFDNCDHNPETLSGISLHCTNGIIIQRPISAGETSLWQEIPQEPCTDISRLQKHSFKAIEVESQNHIPVQKRVAPTAVQSIEMGSNAIYAAISRKEDFVWILSRYKSSEISAEAKEVAGWTGFHHQVSSTEKRNQISKVFFLPSIDESPTKFSTVQEVLFQVKAKSEALGINEADIVLDHAIYRIALEILMDPRNLELMRFINLRMGGFHASCIFIAVIGKRFAAAGLKDLCVESDLVGTASAERIMKGKQYNRAVRALKIVYKALQRSKLEEFKNWLSRRQKNMELVNYLESGELKSLN